MEVDISHMEKEEALAICFAFIKGPKEKPLTKVVEALQYLRSLPEFSSNAKVASAIGVSAETVRQFLAIGRLPKNIREKITGLEQGRRLWQLNQHRPEILEEAAEELYRISSHDLRHTVDYLIRNPSSTVSEAKERVLASKTVVKNFYHVIAELDETAYDALRNLAKRERRNVNDLVSTIVADWLKRN